MTMQEGPRYPWVVVQLTGRDGNAFSVLGLVQRAMREHGIDPGEIARFREEATGGDYDNLLRVCMAWVAVE